MAKQQGVYAKSDLLSPDENRIVEQMYAPKREVLACSVAQLFHAAPNPRVWAKQQTGVIVLIKDHNQRSYYIQFVNIDTHTATYSEELYLELEYNTPYPYFHTFPGERCMVGLNFCSDGEAQNFRTVIQEIAVRNRKRKDKIDAANKPRTAPQQNLAPPAPAPAHAPSPEINKKESKKKDKKKDKKGKKKGITKADISGPSNFQHLSHLGWDKDKNQFDESQIHPALRDLLETAGIKTAALKDEGTAEFIKTFVESHGGMDTLVKEKQRRATIRAQSHGRGPPPAPPMLGQHAPPQPGHHAAPPPPSRSGPPPPPAPSRHAQPPPPVPRQGGRGPPPPPSSRNVPPPPSRGAAPPPPPAAPRAPAAPPAPLAPRAPAAPKAPPAPALGKVAPAAPPAQSGRGNLLDEIKLGRQLKTVNTEASTDGGGGAPGPDNLLDAIRKFGGAAGGLRSAQTERQVAEAPAQDDQLEGMAGALARALAGRNKALAVDSDDDDDSDSDDDWSD